MKKIFHRTVLVLAALLAFFSPLPPTLVFAVSPNQDASQALEIAPPVVNLTANPGETVKTQISLRDISNTALVVKGQVNDFVAAGEDGTPKIILEEGEQSPYSMKSWFGPLAVLNLKSKQIENLTVTINVPKDAAPGGYYSVIRFTATPPDLDTNGVSLSASLGALILMQVKGEAREEMSLESFEVGKKIVINENDSRTDVGGFFESAPLNFVIRMKNSGTVHEQPVGQATVKDAFGNTIATVNVNLEARNVLPGSTRRFESPLDKAVIGDKMLFGRYTADLKMVFGASKTELKKSISFWVIPWKLALGIIFGLIFLFLIIRFALKRYTERVIDRSNYRRRRR